MLVAFSTWLNGKNQAQPRCKTVVAQTVLWATDTPKQFIGAGSPYPSSRSQIYNFLFLTTTPWNSDELTICSLRGRHFSPVIPSSTLCCLTISKFEHQIQHIEFPLPNMILFRFHGHHQAKDPTLSSLNLKSFNSFNVLRSQRESIPHQYPTARILLSRDIVQILSFLCFGNSNYRPSLARVSMPLMNLSDPLINRSLSQIRDMRLLQFTSFSTIFLMIEFMVMSKRIT